MQRLSGLDAAFLSLETPSSPMHVASTAIFDPSTVPGGYSFEKIRDLVERRLHLLPPFRRRLAEVPFQLHHPIWVEDPDFDIGFHVRRAALPAPGGLAELSAFAADVMGRPLDRSRPLWELYVVEGLEHGYVAEVSKVHHAAIDGVSGAELMVNLLDLEPEAPEPDGPAEEWRPDRVPTEAEMLIYAAASLARQPLRAAGVLRRSAEMALKIRSRSRRPDAVAGKGLFDAPRTSLNASLTPHRRLAFVETSLDDVKAVKRAFGTTVNDVVLAVCSGALRRYLDERGELPDDPLVAMVPISVRTEEQRGSMGNRVSSLFVSLATEIDDPVERLMAINGATANAKEQHNAVGAESLMDWAEFAAPAVAARAARLYSRTRAASRHRPLFNVVISNVPGPPFPLYMAGARLVAYYPMGPIFDGIGLNMTVMSYLDTMYFGLVACQETVPGVWDIADHLTAALAELHKEAERLGSR